MSYRLVADENIDRRVVTALEQRGHDVVHVGAHGALEKGIDDPPIARFALDTGRVLLTGDDDFLREFDPAERPPLLFLHDDDLPNSTIVTIVDQIATTIPQDAIEDVLFVSRAWV